MLRKFLFGIGDLVFVEKNLEGPRMMGIRMADDTVHVENYCIPIVVFIHVIQMHFLSIDCISFHEIFAKIIGIIYTTWIFSVKNLHYL